MEETGLKNSETAQVTPQNKSSLYSSGYGLMFKSKYGFKRGELAGTTKIDFRENWSYVQGFLLNRAAGNHTT